MAAIETGASEMTINTIELCVPQALRSDRTPQIEHVVYSQRVT